jgi:hypothetical protein
MCCWPIFLVRTGKANGLRHKSVAVPVGMFLISGAVAMA